MIPNGYDLSLPIVPFDADYDYPKEFHLCKVGDKYFVGYPNASKMTDLDRDVDGYEHMYGTSDGVLCRPLTEDEFSLWIGGLPSS